MFRTSALKDFLSLAGCKTSKPGWGSFPQPNTSKCVQQSQNSVHPYDWKGEGQCNEHYALVECVNMHAGIHGDTVVNLLPEYQTVPKCDIPSLQEDFAILLPHLQQHVKQLWHWKAITLWKRDTRNTVQCLTSRRLSSPAFFGCSWGSWQKYEDFFSPITISFCICKLNFY